MRMEEDGDDLDNLFDEYESNDPQPQENANNKNAENEAVPEKVPVPKRVLKPRLKFNPERLIGKKGIPVLVDHFKDIKFKGKNHEKEDLKKLLTTMELWTHRLFPSMKFDDCLRQIEHLGKKRPVKTCLQKIRLDFPVLDKDFVQNEDEEEQTQPNELESEPPVQDTFDRLFDDYQNSVQPALSSTPRSSHTVGNVLGSSFGAGMSEEQKKRMEYNKMLAIERRKARESTLQKNSLGTSSNNLDTKNEELVFNSPTTEKRDSNNANFFDCLLQNFTNTEVCNLSDKTQGESSQSVQLKDRKEVEMMTIVDESDREEIDHDMSNVRNNEIAESNNRELGLDELLNLVDEDETDHNTSVKNGEDKTDHNTLSNDTNNVYSESNVREVLELDELMDLVDEDD